MYLDPIKEIVVDILYLDDASELKDNQPLHEHGFSSIDYIDFCFEVKSNISDKVEMENLWPFNHMTNAPEYYDGNQWTDKGWGKIRTILDLDENHEQLPPNELVKYFTPQVISNRIEQIVKGQE